jgi:hypothetical protein
MTVEELTPLHCTGCGQRIGFSRRDAAVYCTLICAEDWPVRPNEDRDALIYEIATVEKTGFQYLADEFRTSRQRIQQIVSQRRVN